MAEIDDALTNLCNELNPKIPAKSVQRRKMIWTKAGHLQFQEFDDNSESKHFAINQVTTTFEKAPSFAQCRDLIANDTVFNPTIAMQFLLWSNGSPADVIRYIVTASLENSDGVWCLSTRLAHEAYARFRALLEKREIEWISDAPVLGVHLEVQEIRIDENVLIKSLSLDDINKDIRFIDDPLNAFTIENENRGHRPKFDSKLEITMRRPASNSPQDDSPTIWAQLQTEVAMDRVLSALRLTKAGRMRLGPVSMRNRLREFGTTSTLYPVPILGMDVTITESDVEPLKYWHENLPKNRTNDPVFDRAVDRFFLGTERNQSYDSLVDFVIAMESVLLTIEGESLTSELSYRFAMNGSAVLHGCSLKLDRREAFKFMRCVYDARSAIVHGSAKDRVEKIIRKVGVNNIAEFVKVLEERLRVILRWLASSEVQQRPYKRAGGWEEIVFNDMGP